MGFMRPLYPVSIRVNKSHENNNFNNAFDCLSVLSNLPTLPVALRAKPRV